MKENLQNLEQLVNLMQSQSNYSQNVRMETQMIKIETHSKIQGECQSEGFYGVVEKIKGQENKQRKKKKQKPIHKNLRKGHWSSQESKKYHWFLQIYSKHFIEKEKRREDKIFKKMSTFLGTRQAEQCRSHHQKMQQKHQSFEKIIIYLRNQHYASYQTAPILEDMNINEIKQAAILLQFHELRINEKEKVFLQTPKTVRSEIIEKQSENKQIYAPFENIFEQNQQKQFDFINELFY